jgi:predicted nucleic acid-binding protein
LEFVLDSGGLSALSGRAGRERIRALQQRGLWPPVVPTVVCVESLTGKRRDAAVNQLLGLCDVVEELDLRIARRAAGLRHDARRGSAVDAIVVAIAESLGESIVLTGDEHDLRPLAARTENVRIARA